MKDITRKPLVKDPIEDVNQENRNNKEFFHAMQSHFIRNDLQKIIFMLELVNRIWMNKLIRCIKSVIVQIRN